jgi:meso-butanediol dehydrogenase/(S,S)-butanediol dehydrogenase/diacetyl reductase
MATGSNDARVALVTGAGAGIGRAIALRLAADGFDVVVNDINPAAAATVADEVRNAGRRAIDVCGDVSSKEFVDDLVARTAAELGSLDVLVANAGINIIKPFVDFTEQDLRKIFEINVFGVFYCVQAAARQMIAQGRGGKIINAASAGGKRGYELLGAYSGSPSTPTVLGRSIPTCGR